MLILSDGLKDGKGNVIINTEYREIARTVTITKKRVKGVNQ